VQKEAVLISSWTFLAHGELVATSPSVTLGTDSLVGQHCPASNGVSWTTWHKPHTPWPAQPKLRHEASALWTARTVPLCGINGGSPTQQCEGCAPMTCFRSQVHTSSRLQNSPVGLWDLSAVRCQPEASRVGILQASHVSKLPIACIPFSGPWHASPSGVAASSCMRCRMFST
jgi:hypothetical protein